ncbi:CAP domain-containing protein [Actinoplanes sp. CA-030573]|uniref:CAP domain-containing protein n=1 Tax=Actinoplanes sp. CA-030573 TaxID=3239898 RepID=UPI003D8EBAEE
MSAAARFRYTLVAGATAVVIGTGFTVIGLSRHAEAETAVSTAAADKPVAAVPAAPAVPADSPSPTIELESASPSPSRSASKSPSPKKTTSAPATPKTVKPAARKTAARVPSTGDDVLDAVLAHINEARAREGLGALTLDADLSKASALHNQLMINGCGLEHQCPGEQGLGERFSAQGVKWSSAGENIGFGSSGASQAQIIKAANGLTDSMLAETPPNDGHRKNLLNTGFKRIGLSVVRDSKGITWLTQDFVN